MRNQFLPQLADYYSGGQGQADMVNDVRNSPLYGQMVQAGQEGVLSNAGAMGLSRSGNTAQDLSQSNQGMLQGLVDRRLMGMSSLAQQPLNTNAIAQSMQGIGQTQAQGQMAQGQINQNMYGGMMNAGLGAANNAWGWGGG